VEFFHVSYITGIYTISSHGYTIIYHTTEISYLYTKKTEIQDVKRLILTESEEILYSAYHDPLSRLIFNYVMICFISKYTETVNMAGFGHE
jgi:predicted site-specific integrase-resolvase